MHTCFLKAALKNYFSLRARSHTVNIDLTLFFISIYLSSISPLGGRGIWRWWGPAVMESRVCVWMLHSHNSLKPGSWANPLPGSVQYINGPCIQLGQFSCWVHNSLDEMRCAKAAPVAGNWKGEFYLEAATQEPWGYDAFSSTPTSTKLNQRSWFCCILDPRSGCIWREFTVTLRKVELSQELKIPPSFQDPHPNSGRLDESLLGVSWTFTQNSEEGGFGLQADFAGASQS